MPNWDEIQTRIKDAVNRVGAPLEIIDASKVVLETTTGIRGSFKRETAPATLTENVDVVFTMPHDVSSAEKGNFIRVNNEIYKIVASEITAPGTDVLMRKVYASR